MMAASKSPFEDYDILSVDPVEERFGIEILSYDDENATTAMRMPVTSIRHPMTGGPTLGAVPLLVDDSGCTVAYALRGRRWPVTSELNIQLRHDAMATLERSAGEYLLSRSHALDVTSEGALSVCHLTVGDRAVGTATVRTVLVIGDLSEYERPVESLTNKTHRSLAELMAATPSAAVDGVHRLVQQPDPMLCNVSTSVHGGIAATGLELVASAAIEAACGPGFWTGSLQVNYLHPFAAGHGSHYAGWVTQRGSRVAVAEAHALNADARPAVTARLTAYRSA